ncbi:cyclic nucleotide-gated ion channel [Microbaculum marinum]|uniref:Cyclic nucleotide-gated ion channel n=1 Tax=Microbaculum marinum TaxID=1764581 RepID=A0AAW9S3V6_9HYPH
MSGTADPLRRRVYAILEREDPDDRVARAVYRIIVAVIVINVVTAILYTDRKLSWLFPADFRVIEAVSLIVFGVEYVARLWACVESPHYRGMSPWRARMRYVVTPAALIDLIALVPFFVVHVAGTDMRALAMLRLLRFLKLARYSPGLSSLVEAIRAERHGLVACFVVLCGGIVIAASAMYAAEGAVQPDKFGSIPEAMWWAVATITTVGYGDVVPVTSIGQIIGGFTMIAGILMLALPVGIFATAFIEVIRRRAFVVTWGMVARLPAFSTLDAATLADIVPKLRAKAVEAGEIVVPRGQVPRAIFFVVSGKVSIDHRGEITELAHGEHFGEVHARNLDQIDARVRAIEATQLLVLAGDDIDAVSAASPELAARLAGVSTFTVV